MKETFAASSTAGLLRSYPPISALSASGFAAIGRLVARSEPGLRRLIGRAQSPSAPRSELHMVTKGQKAACRFIQNRDVQLAAERSLRRDWGINKNSVCPGALNCQQNCSSSRAKSSWNQDNYVKRLSTDMRRKTRQRRSGLAMQKKAASFTTSSNSRFWTAAPQTSWVGRDSTELGKEPRKIRLPISYRITATKNCENAFVLCRSPHPQSFFLWEFPPKIVFGNKCNK